MLGFIKLAIQVILAIIGIFKPKIPPHPGDQIRTRQDRIRTAISKNDSRTVLREVRNILLRREAKLDENEDS